MQILHSHLELEDGGTSLLSGREYVIWNCPIESITFHLKKISDVTYTSFEFLDEHHILYADSPKDCICVFDLRRCSGLGTGAETRHQRFKLDLPPIQRARTSRYIQVRRNALPMQGPDEFRDGENDDDTSTCTPPFYADPRARLVLLRIVTSPAGTGEKQLELHVSAQALLEHFATSRNTGTVVVVPWSAWRADTAVALVQTVQYLPQARMTAYGMRTVSHPPNCREGVLYLNSYPPRRERAGMIGARTRQGIPLPDKSPEMANLLSALCEDGLLCYQVMSFPLN